MKVKVRKNENLCWEDSKDRTQRRDYPAGSVLEVPDELVPQLVDAGTVTVVKPSAAPAAPAEPAELAPAAPAGAKGRGKAAKS